MISEKEYKKSKELVGKLYDSIRKANDIIEKYENQQNIIIIDDYVKTHLNGYTSWVEALPRMEYLCRTFGKPVYCYLTSSNRLIVTLEKLQHVNPERVLMP